MFYKLRTRYNKDISISGSLNKMLISRVSAIMKKCKVFQTMVMQARGDSEPVLSAATPVKCMTREVQQNALVCQKTVLAGIARKRHFLSIPSTSRSTRRFPNATGTEIGSERCG